MTDPTPQSEPQDLTAMPASQETAKDAVKTSAQAPNYWIEYGPIAVYVIVYNVLRRTTPDTALITAACVFMVAAVGAVVWSKVKGHKISPILILTTMFIVGAVLLSLFTGNPIFFFMKPTAVNILFGIGVIGGALLGKNVLKMLMGSAYAMPDAAWNKFAIRWGLFFFASAALNEVIWRNFSEDFWSNFKLFGFVPLTFLFILSQLPFLLKHSDLKARMAETPKPKD